MQTGSLTVNCFWNLPLGEKSSFPSSPSSWMKSFFLFSRGMNFISYFIDFSFSLRVCRNIGWRCWFRAHFVAHMETRNLITFFTNSSRRHHRAFPHCTFSSSLKWNQSLCGVERFNLWIPQQFNVDFNAAMKSGYKSRLGCNRFIDSYSSNELFYFYQHWS